jgi:hypothetical protein
MRRGWFSLAFAIFQTVWLNVVIPGHQRGVVQLPGAASACPCCCCADAHGGNSDSKSLPAKPGQCALCFFAAHLSTPPVLNISLPPLRLLQLVQPEKQSSLLHQSCLLSYDSRGPPSWV